MHGFTGRFYEQHPVAIGRRLAERGHLFVTGNNRGHHLGANVVNKRGGAWFEKFDESPRDFSAWIGFAVALGFPRVVLVGHSLGAIKAVHYNQTVLARARTNLDVYGLHGGDAPIAKVRCPVLFVLGSNEPNIAVEADLVTLTRNATAASRADTLYVEGADHVYTDRALPVADGIGDWLETLG